MLLLAVFSLALATTVQSFDESACNPFPASMSEFSAQFEQPKPPLVYAEFKTSFLQHKWYADASCDYPRDTTFISPWLTQKLHRNENISHIASGYIYNSPTQELVRVHYAYDGGLASSSFDYTNMTNDGLVDNTVITFNESGQSVEWRGYAFSNFPLFVESFLVDSGAVFGGLMNMRVLGDRVASWSIMYGGLIPVTVYVNACNIVVGYEYFTSSERTRTITLFFNTLTGPVHIRSIA